MRTEIPFNLPRGLTEEAGGVHTEGTMRLATARDEIEPLRDPEVRRNEAYLSVLLLARTVTRIGEITEITPEVIEALFAADFDHLQRLYERVNTDGAPVGWRRRAALCRLRAGGGPPASPITSTGRSTRSSISSTGTGVTFSP